MDILSPYFSYNKQYGPQIYFARMCLTKNLDFNRSVMVFETSTEIILDVCTIYSMAYSPIKSSIEDLMFICQPVRNLIRLTCPMRLFFPTLGMYERRTEFHTTDMMND